MLQRAASNAYSWWWASHIRTKQSKWMEQNLLDMEEKVEVVLKLLQEDGDSFAKRAEMYYKGRPELIAFVEETYRAYRALAERYDHISKELQNANNTIASICPDQVPFMDEDDDDGSPRAPRKAQEGFKANAAEGFKANAAEGFKANPAEGFKVNAAEGFKANASPKVPKPPLKDLKSVITSASKKFGTKKTPKKSSTPKESIKSGLSKKEALEEIDKLQKKILTLQTVKEFVKSSYDNAIAKYWDTEEEIKELQERVSRLQDEFGEGMVIEDDEARRLMTEAALKTCQETLAQLLVKQERSFNDTKIETTRVKAIKEKLEGLMREFHYDQINRKEPRARKDVKEVLNIKDLDEDVERMTQQRQELQLLQDKIKEQFEAGSYTSISVTEMAEKIDELVNKVVSLETSVSSQDALIMRMRTETDELQSQIQTLEDDKASLVNEKTDLNNPLREMDEKMHGIQYLNQMVETQNSNLQTHFTEARCDLDHLFEEVQNVKPDEADEVMDISKRESKSSGESVSKQWVVGQDTLNQERVLLNDVKSEKKHKVAVLADVDVQKDDEIKVAGLVDNDVHKDNEIKVTGLGKNDVQKDNEIKVTGSVDNDVRKDNEIKVTDSLENDTKSDNKLEVTGSLEKHEASPMASKTPIQPKEQEKPPCTSNSDAVARSSPSIPVGDQDPSQHKASKEANSFSESSGNQQAKNGNQISLETENTHEVHSQEQATAQEEEPDWRQLFMDGMQDKEKVLLSEYTNTLRNYKEVKKKLSEAEKKTQDTLFDTSVKLKQLKTSNALKDEEIKLLRRKLGLMERSLEGNEDMAESRAVEEPADEEEDEEIFKVDQPDSTSAIEEKFRRNIDEILEENLGFWLKFSTTFTEIQKFETTIKDLQTDVSKLEEKGKSSESVKQSVKSDARPIFKHLVEIQDELSVWLDKSASLKEELQRRSSSLCEIQEEITKALKASAEDDDFKFTSYQAAKFQGEVLNMKQENNKVADELQAGLDHVSNLQLDVEKDLAKMGEQFGLSNSKRHQTAQLRHSESSRSRVPLGAFIFGVKPKKQKHSIFSSITPGMHRKYRALKGHGYM